MTFSILKDFRKFLGGYFMEDKILKFVSVDDVPEGCKDLVDVFGMDVFIRLIEFCGGSSIYLPSKGSVFKMLEIGLLGMSLMGVIFESFLVGLGLVICKLEILLGKLVF
ncbi:hypothetical protein H477_2497 [[Clostridium] sordellii ATCC 9714]|nr:hypothetical protein H477_2497 [[Clostridium] sordellii ATCC 9714] [Paeniclostridium sordellii ATCC 9714]